MRQMRLLPVAPRPLDDELLSCWHWRVASHYSTSPQRVKAGYPGRLAAKTKTSPAPTSIPIEIPLGFGHSPVASVKPIRTDCHCKAPGGPKALS